MRAPTSYCVSKQRKGSEFNGAMDEGSRRFKSEHQRCTACENSEKCQEFNGAMEEASRALICDHARKEPCY